MKTTFCFDNAHNNGCPFGKSICCYACENIKKCEDACNRKMWTGGDSCRNCLAFDEYDPNELISREEAAELTGTLIGIEHFKEVLGGIRIDLLKKMERYGIKK